MEEAELSSSAVQFVAFEFRTRQFVARRVERKHCVVVGSLRGGKKIKLISVGKLENELRTYRMWLWSLVLMALLRLHVELAECFDILGETMAEI